MQIVDFPVEILVYDDVSPDHTADIIRKYEEKYPWIIKPIYQTENQYSQGIDVSQFNLGRIRGKYVAQCEGDDYWTDPEKLKIQVDFLEKHPEYVGTAHSYMFVDTESKPIPEAEIIGQLKGIFTLSDIQYYRLPGSTASLIYRDIFKNLSETVTTAYYNANGYGDQKLAVLLTLHGPIHRFEKVMSAYRYVPIKGTSYSATTSWKNLCEESYQYLVEMENFATVYYNTSLNTYALAMCFIFLAIAKYLHHPNEENLRVLKEIVLKKSQYPLYTKMMIRTMINSPLHFLDIMTQAGIERLGTRRILKKVTQNYRLKTTNDTSE